VPEEVLFQVEQGGAQPDAARIVIVDKNIGLEFGFDKNGILVEGRDPGKDVPRRHGLARQVIADGDADVVKVAHHEQRRDVVEKVGQSEQAVDLLLRGEGQGLEEGGGDGQPVGGRVHLVLGKAQVSGADIFLGEELDLFEPDDLSSDMDLAMRDQAAFQLLLVEHVQDLDLGVIDGVGEIVNIGFLDVGLALLEVESLDEVLLALAQVDRLGGGASSRLS